MPTLTVKQLVAIFGAMVLIGSGFAWSGVQGEKIQQLESDLIERKIADDKILEAVHETQLKVAAIAAVLGIE